MGADAEGSALLRPNPQLRLLRYGSIITLVSVAAIKTLLSKFIFYHAPYPVAPMPPVQRARGTLQRDPAVRRWRIRRCRRR